jgi:hypothetical protein
MFARVLCGFLAPVLLFATSAVANDRLPARLRAPYAKSFAEARKYVRYILRKVWRPKIAALRGKHAGDRKALQSKTDALVDEISHLLLPYGKKLVHDVVFGTGETHLRLTMPERKKASREAALASLQAFSTGSGGGPPPKSPSEAMQQALSEAGGTYEREVNDRLDQALAEDIEDFTQREVESRVGLPVAGRTRDRMRTLPAKWEKPYQEIAREEVHRFNHWYLRKRRRLQLAHLAATQSQEELDRARHTGRVWGITSGISYEAWAQNRLRIDFKWGRFNWETDRRHIRRRMDQDEAQATWALAKLVKELTSPGSTRELENHLQKRVREELSRDLRAQAEQYPRTAPELEQRLQALRRELDPIMNRAMDRVKLPDLPDNLKELAREHGRRYTHEEMQNDLGRAIQREAMPYAAAQRVSNSLGMWVSDALARYETAPGTQPPEEARSRVLDHVKKEVRPLIDESIERTLGEVGLDEKLWNQETRKRTVRDVKERFDLDKAIERETDRQLNESGRRP